MLPKICDEEAPAPSSSVRPNDSITAAATSSLESGIQLAGSAAELKPISSTMETNLPIALSPKWVAYACRMSGLAKPRWSREGAVWTTSVIGQNGIEEAITISKGPTLKSVVVKVEWLSWEGEPSETATARRLIATFITGMQWTLRQQLRTRMSLSALR